MNLEQLNKRNHEKFKSMGYKDIETSIENSIDNIPLNLVTTATKNNTVYLFRFNFKNKTLTKSILYHEKDIIINSKVV